MAQPVSEQTDRARMEASREAFEEAWLERVCAESELRFAECPDVVPDDFPEDWFADWEADWPRDIDGDLDPVDAMDPVPLLVQALRDNGFPEHVVSELVTLSISLQQNEFARFSVASLDGEGSLRGSTLPDELLAAAAEATFVLGRGAPDHRIPGLQPMRVSAGRKSLDAQGIAHLDELSKTARLRWRANAKSALATELEFMTGSGRQTCHDWIGFALASPVATAAARRALSHGETDLETVRAWFTKCRNMTPEDAASVGEAVFASKDPATISPDSDTPANPAEGDERGGAANVGDSSGVDDGGGHDDCDDNGGGHGDGDDNGGGGDGDGDITEPDDADHSAEPGAGDSGGQDPSLSDPGGAPEGRVGPGTDVTERQSKATFRRSLSREVNRVQSSDPEADRARRKRARKERGLWVRADDDGTATLTMRGPTSAIIGALDRVESIARKARARGDERTLQQLRHDAACALLVHGKIPVADWPTTESSNRKGSAGAGTRSADTNGAGTNGPGTNGPGTNGPGTNGPSTSAGCSGAPVRAPDAGDGPMVDLTTLQGTINATGPVKLNVIVPLDALLNADSTAVAELADHGIFITAQEVREIALQPGTTIHRLLTDPLTGQCLDRSIKAYRPDKAMRDLLEAMDVTCRAPGCTVPASRCEADHEKPYHHEDPDAGGQTTAGNLTLKSKAHHQNKTDGLLETLMEPTTREMIWRTLFGRIYRTYPHDFRQYANGRSRPGQSPTPPAATSADATNPSAPSPESPAPLPPWPTILDSAHGPNLNDIDLRDRLIYAALTERRICQDRGLAGWDDFDGAEAFDPPVEDFDPPFEAPVEMFHHTPGGAPRRGANPGHSPTHDLLHPNEPTEAELAAEREQRRRDADKPPF